MSLPSLRLLQASGQPLVICARPWARDLLDGLGQVEFLSMTGQWRVDRKAVSLHRQAMRGQARGLLLPDSLSSAAIFRLAGVPCAGYRDDGRSLLLRWPFKKPARTLHAVQSWYHLTRLALQAWHLPSGPAQPTATLGLPLTQRHRHEATMLLDQAGLIGRAFVLIAPTATGQHKGKVKVWPGFDRLTRALQAHGYTVVMCPPAAESQQAQRTAPSARLLAPLGLGAFACLTTLAALVICNDSGVSHVAAAAGARTLTLFGVTERERTGPWSSRAVCLGNDQAWPSDAEVERKAFQLLSTADVIRAPL